MKTCNLDSLAAVHSHLPGNILVSVALATLLSVSSPFLADNACAALFDVELIDNNGPHIVGEVNTATDTFTINTWTENAGGVVWWSPSDLPRTYNAQTTTGSFDVPDNWDGTIGTNWGFINPQTMSDNSWNNGTFLNTLFREGWGGLVDGFGVFNVSFDETRWGNTAFNSNSVSLSTVFDSVTVSPVPEPSTFGLYGIGLMTMSTLRWRRFGASSFSSSTLIRNKL